VKASLEPIRLDRTHGGSLSRNGIDFSTSLNPLGPPAEAIRAYHEAATIISQYPPPYPRHLEARIASWLDIDPETVIAGNGSTQLIYLAARILGLKSPAVVIPTFSEIANALIASGSEPLPIPLKPEDNFRLEFQTRCDALQTGTDTIFIGRPNSPTGTLIGLDEIAAIEHECAQRGGWCVVDEAFIEFADDPCSAITLMQVASKLVVLRSLTKIFAIPGLRLGYLVGPVDFVRKLRDAIEPWSVNAIAEFVALACLEVAEPFMAQSRGVIREERSRLRNELRGIPIIKVFPSAANFLMFSVEGEPDAGDFGRYTLGQGLAIRDLSSLPGCATGFYRIGVRLRQDNDRFVALGGAYSGARGQQIPTKRGVGLPRAQTRT
jgi:threonine-phosphate decarboxylase